jgi:hypothetical protein
MNPVKESHTSGIAIADITGMTEGAVPFGEAGGGGLAQDATNFFWDDTNNRLGIGTNAPNARLHVSQQVSTSGTPVEILQLDGGAHTTLAASVEATDVFFNLDRTVEFSTGALTANRAVRITSPTYNFVGASTLTSPITLEISGPPKTSANGTFTSPRAVRIGTETPTLGPTSAAFNYATVELAAHTITVTGATGVTSTVGAAALFLGIITVSDASAMTMDAAATLYIQGAPVGGSAGPTTITNAYAIWVDAGNVRIDGNVSIAGVITGTINAIGAVSTDSALGELWVNTTAAAAGAQQYSPMAVDEGQGWKTDATAASQEVQFGRQVIPIEGAANPTGAWVLFSNINDAGWVERLRLTSGGVVTFSNTRIGATDPILNRGCRFSHIDFTTVSNYALQQDPSADNGGVVHVSSPARVDFEISSTMVFQINSATLVTFADAVNIATNATTGTKIGTATSQKLGFWNATPVIQQAHIADPAGGATVDTEARTAINSILAQFATLGLHAAS